MQAVKKQHRIGSRWQLLPILSGKVLNGFPVTAMNGSASQIYLSDLLLAYRKSRPVHNWIGPKQFQRLSFAHNPNLISKSFVFKSDLSVLLSKMKTKQTRSTTKKTAALAKAIRDDTPPPTPEPYQDSPSVSPLPEGEDNPIPKKGMCLNVYCVGFH